jgi:DNA mismatch repair protein MutS2
MNKSAFVALEFDKVREVLAGLAETEAGRTRARKLEPSGDSAWIRAALEETSEGRRLRDESQDVSLDGLPSIEEELSSLAIAGRTLGVDAFARLARLARASNRTRRLLSARSEEAPRLAARASELPRLESFEERILLVVDVEAETVRDDASPELKRLREKTKKLKARLGKVLDQTLASRENAKMLQEPLVTSRNERSVLPVRAEYKSQFPGIVHGASATGATLFIEPLQTVELNNELAALHDREREEVRRILGALTETIRPEREALALAVAILGELDLAGAKARFSEIADGEAPVVSDEVELRLMEARHPLLIPAIASLAGYPRPESGPVPLTFQVADGRRGLIFTGPNTGGKTVALKTAGLLALMVQSGLHAPARSSSCFPVFRSVFADIGDDQSIGSSLSTFSAHLAKVIQMERELESPALVILDEVGTGTDPAEGGALGTALVEHFLARGALVLASTHHGQLKAYALTTEGISAASFDFDPVTYAPTYRVIEGAAGKSLAFEMAERLGLPRVVVSRARALQEERERQVEELVTRLERENVEIGRERARISADRRAAAEARQKLEAGEALERQERNRRLREFQATLEEELEATERKLKEIVAEATRTADEMRASREEERGRLKELEKNVVGRIAEIATPLLESARAAAGSGPEPEPEAIRAGMRVLVSSYGISGVVERIAGDEAEVRVRDKKLRLPLRTLEALPGIEVEPPAPAPVPARRPEAKQVPEELNLIGRTVEEALDEADKFLDDALLSEYRQVRLIHGHGTGRLKSALREWLKSHPHVGKLESDSRGGVTVVEFKD